MRQLLYISCVCAIVCAAGFAAESTADQNFVDSAAAGNQSEIDLGKLGQSKATDAAVRNFSDQLIKDHEAVGQQLTAIAKQEGVALPKAHAGTAKPASGLSQLSGSDFDRAFMDKVIADHKSTIDLFKSEAKSGSNAEMKNFAEKTLPHLQHHLAMAEEINRSLAQGKTEAAPVETKHEGVRRSGSY